MAMEHKSDDVEDGTKNASEKQLRAAANAALKKSGSILAVGGKSAQRKL